MAKIRRIEIRTTEASMRSTGSPRPASTLATFTKYPRESSYLTGKGSGISSKKFGFMQSEKELFAEVAEDVGLLKKTGKRVASHRHPLAFLVEAADDICYHVMDIEDGFRAGIVSFDELRDLH
jgi:dGTPase